MGELQWMGSMRIRILLDARESNGRLSIMDERGEAGDSSPRHVHSREDESWVVLAGRVTAFRGDECRSLVPGDSLFLPRGVPHAFRMTAAASRMLITYTPGGHEELFRAAGWDLDQPLPGGWAVSLAQVTELAVQLGAQLLGPAPDGAGAAVG